MKDREPEALLKQVEAWHNHINRLTKKGKAPIKWDRHPFINDYLRKEGKKDNPVIYKIVQLLSTNDLNTEGRRLKHCVSSYARSCAGGAVSIWSVRRMQPGDCWEPLGTVELRNPTSTIVQFRAKYNAKPEIKAYNLVERWARKEGLKFSSWI